MTASEIVNSVNTHYKQGFVSKEIHFMLNHYKQIDQEKFYNKLENVNIYMQGKEVVYLKEDVELAVKEGLC